MKLNEIWKKVEGYNYSVSSLGRVRNDKTNRILKPRTSGNGYMSVSLYKNGNGKNFKIHRLVATCFINNPYKKPQINHKNGNKLDNAVSNLEWSTSKENIKHAVVNGLSTQIFKKGVIGKYQFKKGNTIGAEYRFKKGHKGIYAYKHSKKVRVLETGEIFNSINDCARTIDGTVGGISDALHGRIHTHRGFHFEYIS